MTVRIGLFAEAFGFGPVSKVCSLAKAYQEVSTCELFAFGDSITNEYFRREGINNIIELIHSDVENPSRVKSICTQIDIAIVGIQPEWAGEIQQHIPVIYLDSLGFMWNEKYFHQYPKLKTVEAFLVQDIFGAAQSLFDKGIKNIHCVGPLISTNNLKKNTPTEPVIHMGGLANIFNNKDGFLYADFIATLLKGKVKEAICSDYIASCIDKKKYSIDFHALTNEQTINRFSSAEILYTSPGLTGLLEAAAVNANIVPLPPQNYSQALIVDKIEKLQKERSVWSFLKEHYPVNDGLDEEEGVFRVRELNKKYMHSTEFRENYLNSINNFGPKKLPNELAINNGIREAVKIVSSLTSKL